MTKDFRYKLEGQTVEAFQVTKASRYQQKTMWPDWMDSRWLVSYEHGELRLNVNDVEKVIPDYGWIVKYPDGSISAVSYDVMETADKVVKEVEPVHPRADAGITDEQLAKVHGLDLPKGPKVVPKHDSYHARQLMTEPTSPAEFPELNRLVDIYVLLDPETEAARKLRELVAPKIHWCQCPPGQCAGLVDMVCREKSPLAK